MLTLLRFVVLFAATAYAGIALYMYLQQRNLQYFPANKGLSPADTGLAGVSVEKLQTADGETILAWYAETTAAMPTILFLHGNAGEISDRAARLAYYQSHGFGVLFLSYRGYGGSSGAISEAGFITDAVSAYDWLLKRGVAPERIAVVGESLGTGVAVQLAAARPVAALALEAPYTATVDVAAIIYWWLPVRLLMKDPFLSRNFIIQVKAPLLVQHGDADTIIPVAQGRKLFALANEPKQLVIMPGAGHDAISTPEVWTREIDFISKTLAAQ